ncbi:MAG: preprotein translocase subunit YajC [Treponema sp.]|jgi:preprotein translocase subunit YajC|nr:preprotein translocase subunit YajC [Treponema sp.]
MNSFFLSLLMGVPPAGAGTADAPTGPAAMLQMFFPFILIIGIFYFLIIRPQNKKQKETQKMLSALKKGDRIVTIGGIHGTIANVRENTVIVRVDDATKMEFSRSAISSVEAVARENEERKSEAQIEKNDEKLENAKD